MSKNRSRERERETKKEKNNNPVLVRNIIRDIIDLLIPLEMESPRLLKTMKETAKSYIETITTKR